MNSEGKGKYIPSMGRIAQELGVSITTVSRALKGEGRLSDGTKAKVLEAAGRLGYSRNLLVGGIRGSGTKTIGISLNVTEEYWSKLLDSLVAGLWRRGYAPLVLSPKQAEPGYAESDVLKAFLERRVEGVILRPLVHNATPEYFKELSARGLPIVFVDCELPGVEMPFSGTNDYKGGWLAAERLIALGHKRIALQPGAQLASTGRLRKQGFLDCAAKHPELSVAISKVESFTPDRNALMELLSSTPRPTALALASDDLAAGAYEAAAALGLRIPEDLSVIGFGNLRDARLLKPALSSFEQKPQEIGENAVSMMLSLIGREPLPKSKILSEPELLERESLAKPSIKDGEEPHAK